MVIFFFLLFQGMAGLNYSNRDPMGVCALITPWNLPLYLLTWKVTKKNNLDNFCNSEFFLYQKALVCVSQKSLFQSFYLLFFCNL
jgi:hypothetical protein